jgi:hypothetical protein
MILAKVCTGRTLVGCREFPRGAPQTMATTWDFSILDAITQPVLDVGDHRPEFQIAVDYNFLDLTYPAAFLSLKP